ncbi:MAG: hypothetical protein PVF70_12115 [Anaerolineales bacterium]|jgi:hypothetical protein
MADDFDMREPLPEEAPNRTFAIVAAVIGGLLVVSLACLALYMLVISPRQKAERDRIATETAMAGVATATVEIQQVEPTATNTPTPTATNTPTSTATPTNTAEPLAEPTATPTATPVALPDTGVIDDIGVPMLALMAGALIAVVFLARYLRGRAAR